MKSMTWVIFKGSGGGRAVTCLLAKLLLLSVGSFPRKSSFTISMCLNIGVFLLSLLSNLIILWSENKACRISALFKIELMKALALIPDQYL